MTTYIVCHINSSRALLCSTKCLASFFIILAFFYFFYWFSNSLLLHSLNYWFGLSSFCLFTFLLSFLFLHCLHLLAYHFLFEAYLVRLFLLLELSLPLFSLNSLALSFAYTTLG